MMGKSPFRPSLGLRIVDSFFLRRLAIFSSERKAASLSVRPGPRRSPIISPKADESCLEPGFILAYRAMLMGKSVIVCSLTLGP